jgi:hypothetical protein
MKLQGMGQDPPDLPSTPHFSSEFPHFFFFLQFKKPEQSSILNEFEAFCPLLANERFWHRG